MPAFYLARRGQMNSSGCWVYPENRVNLLLESAMEHDSLMSSPWAGPCLWAVVYLSDYYLTIAGALVYRRGANQHYVIECSYELTPSFQGDVSRLRWFSPLFATYLVGTTLALFALRWLATDIGFPQLYRLLLGSLLSIEV